MFRVLAIWITIINTSSTTLHNTTLVIDDEAVYVGTIDSDKGKKIEVDDGDKIQILFTTNEEREDWLATEVMDWTDVVRISDDTITYEVDVDFYDE